MLRSRRCCFVKIFAERVSALHHRADSRGSSKKSGLLWRLLARVCEINADYDQALTFLTEALREDPKDVAALSMLARSAEKRWEMDEAALWHRRILEINPCLPVSNLFLARQHYAQGEYEAALPYFVRLRLKERHNRTYRLFWLLAFIRVSGVNGVEDQFEEIRTWQDLTTEEQALVQELFLLAGERSLEEDARGLSSIFCRRCVLLPPRVGPRYWQRWNNESRNEPCTRRSLRRWRTMKKP